MCAGIWRKVVLVLAILFARMSFADVEKPIIRQVKIYRTNVFADSQPEAKKFPFKLANKFHLVTKERVIKRELLFFKGDRLDSAKLEETERNLRKLEYLTGARIIPQIHSDSADIGVYTQDSWTLSPSASASGGGGKRNFRVGIDDENFLGWGQTLAFYYSQDNREFFKEEIQGLFYDPSLLPGHTGLLLSLNKLSYGHFSYLNLSRPFYSLTTPWSFKIELSDLKDRAGFFQEGRELIRNNFQSQKVQLGLALARGEYSRKEFRLNYGYRFEKYRPVEHSIGLDTTQVSLSEAKEKLGWVSFSFRRAELKFATTKNLDRYQRTEDLELGWAAQIGAGPALEILGSQDKSWFTESYLRLACRLSGQQFFTVSAKNSGFWQAGDFTKAEHRFRLNYYNQGLPGQTLVLGFTALGYAKQLKYRQFILGGASGLRGFGANLFSGTKAAVINLEDRFFSHLQILTFGIGGAIFLDGGYSWNKTEDINFPKDLRWSYGIGLRLGPTRAYANRVIRLDLAKGFDAGDYFFSFGLGQVIGWDGLQN